MTAPITFPRNLWRKEINIPHWTLRLKWSAEIVCTKKGWRAKAAMKPFLLIKSNSMFETREDAITSLQGLFEGFVIHPWAPESTETKWSTSILQCLELIKTKDNTWLLYSSLDQDYGYEFDSKEEAQEMAELEWVHRFQAEPE